MTLAIRSETKGPGSPSSSPEHAPPAEFEPLGRSQGISTSPGAIPAFQRNNTSDGHADSPLTTNRKRSDQSNETVHSRTLQRSGSGFDGEKEVGETLLRVDDALRDNDTIALQRNKAREEDASALQTTGGDADVVCNGGAERDRCRNGTRREGAKLEDRCPGPYGRRTSILTSFWPLAPVEHKGDYSEHTTSETTARHGNVSGSAVQNPPADPAAPTAFNDSVSSESFGDATAERVNQREEGPIRAHESVGVMTGPKAQSPPKRDVRNGDIDDDDKVVSDSCNHNNGWFNAPIDGDDSAGSGEERSPPVPRDFKGGAGGGPSPGGGIASGGSSVSQGREGGRPSSASTPTRTARAANKTAEMLGPRAITEPSAATMDSSVRSTDLRPSRSMTDLENFQPPSMLRTISRYSGQNLAEERRRASRRPSGRRHTQVTFADEHGESMTETVYENALYYSESGVPSPRKPSGSCCVIS